MGYLADIGDLGLSVDWCVLLAAIEADKIKAEDAIEYATNAWSLAPERAEEAVREIALESPSNRDRVCALLRRLCNAAGWNRAVRILRYVAVMDDLRADLGEAMGAHVSATFVVFEYRYGLSDVRGVLERDDALSDDEYLSRVQLWLRDEYKVISGIQSR